MCNLLSLHLGVSVSASPSLRPSASLLRRSPSLYISMSLWVSRSSYVYLLFEYPASSLRLLSFFGPLCVSASICVSLRLYVCLAFSASLCSSASLPRLSASLPRLSSSFHISLSVNVSRSLLRLSASIFSLNIPASSLLLSASSPASSLLGPLCVSLRVHSSLCVFSAPQQRRLCSSRSTSSTCLPLSTSLCVSLS